MKSILLVCVSRLVVSDSLWSHGLWPTRLLCPWNSLGKNTGAIPFSRDPTCISCITGRFFKSEPPGKQKPNVTFEMHWETKKSVGLAWLQYPFYCGGLRGVSVVMALGAQVLCGRKRCSTVGRPDRDWRVSLLTTSSGREQEGGTWGPLGNSVM